MFRQTRRIFGKATAVTGINDDFVRWGMDRGRLSPAHALRSFALGYPRLSLRQPEQVGAREFWASMGVGVRPDHFIVCFFGVFGRTLDLAPVFDAARALAAEPVQFVLCGVGDELSYVQRQSADLPNVVLPGWIDASRIHALMSIASVGLAPYRNTPDFQASIPNKAVESWPAGCRS